LSSIRKENDTRLTGYFTAANGSSIPAYEKVDLTVTLGLNKAFSWSFVKAGVQRAVIGIDFLENFNLILDLSRRELSLPNEKTRNWVKRELFSGPEDQTEVKTPGKNDQPTPEATPILPPAKVANSVEELLNNYHHFLT